MRELRVGDPADIATDVGPLIDDAGARRASRRICGHAVADPLPQPLPECLQRGVFVAPTLIEIQSVERAQGRGVRTGTARAALRPARDCAQLIDAINATGYGLTLGIASRIEGTIGEIDRARARRQCLRQSQHDRRRGRSATVRRTGACRAPARRPVVRCICIGCCAAHRARAGTLDQRGRGRRRRGSCGIHRLAARAAVVHWLTAQQRIGAVAQSRALRPHDTARRAHRRCRATSARATSCSCGRAACCVRPHASTAALLATAGGGTGDRQHAVGGSARARRPRLRAALPGVLRASLPSADCAIEAVLVDALEAQRDPQWLRQLCQRSGRGARARSCRSSSTNDGYALERLLVEQAVSINTAAVGGDTRLLALDDD